MTLISIILPSLNTDLSFLAARVESICWQSITNWECIVIDGFSSNGSFQYLKSFETDTRFRVYQLPRKGIYNAWNEGIKLAKGEFIYIATSDDTMDKFFLEKMVAALNTNPACDIAHCSLKIIDENGHPSTSHVWNAYPSAKFFNDNIYRSHVRRAPHDGLLHAFIKTVYHSITQLLIRKSVFDQLGLFLEHKGPIADFEWGLRVSLYKNVVHVPEPLATWRVHDAQATTSDIQADPKTYATLIAWVEEHIQKYLEDDTDSRVDLKALTSVYRNHRSFYKRASLKKRNNLIYRIANRINPVAPLLDGLKEAHLYFDNHQLSKLIVQSSPHSPLSTHAQ
jgi:glycosyltransferase involved in cell wall biosynthesis